MTSPGLSNISYHSKSLLDELKIKKANFVGHSMGGQIWIQFDMMYQERIDKLILVLPAGIEKFDEGEGE